MKTIKELIAEQALVKAKVSKTDSLVDKMVVEETIKEEKETDSLAPEMVVEEKVEETSQDETPLAEEMIVEEEA